MKLITVAVIVFSLSAIIKLHSFALRLCNIRITRMQHLLVVSNEGEKADIQKLLRSAEEDDAEWLYSVFGDSLKNIFTRNDEGDQNNLQDRNNVNSSVPVSRSIADNDLFQPINKFEESTVEDKDNELFIYLQDLGYTVDEIRSIRLPVLNIIAERSIRRPRKSIPPDWLLIPNKNTFSQLNSDGKVESERQQRVRNRAIDQPEDVLTADNSDDASFDDDIPRIFWPDEEEFKGMLLEESRWRADIIGDWALPFIKQEAKWRYGTYKGWLRFIEDGLGDAFDVLPEDFDSETDINGQNEANDGQRSYSRREGTYNNKERKDRYQQSISELEARVPRSIPTPDKTGERRDRREVPARSEMPREQQRTVGNNPDMSDSDSIRGKSWRGPSSKIDPLIVTQLPIGPVDAGDADKSRQGKAYNSRSDNRQSRSSAVDEFKQGNSRVDESDGSAPRYSDSASSTTRPQPQRRPDDLVRSSRRDVTVYNGRNSGPTPAEQLEIPARVSENYDSRNRDRINSRENFGNRAGDDVARRINSQRTSSSRSSSRSSGSGGSSSNKGTNNRSARAYEEWLRNRIVAEAPKWTDLSTEQKKAIEEIREARRVEARSIEREMLRRDPYRRVGVDYGDGDDRGIIGQDWFTSDDEEDGFDGDEEERDDKETERDEEDFDRAFDEDFDRRWLDDSGNNRPRNRKMQPGLGETSARWIRTDGSRDSSRGSTVVGVGGRMPSRAEMSSPKPAPSKWTERSFRESIERQGLQWEEGQEQMEKGEAFMYSEAELGSSGEVYRQAWKDSESRRPLTARRVVEKSAAVGASGPLGAVDAAVGEDVNEIEEGKQTPATVASKPEANLIPPTSSPNITESESTKLE